MGGAAAPPNRAHEDFCRAPGKKAALKFYWTYS
jgi:hypothetical protein